MSNLNVLPIAEKQLTRDEALFYERQAWQQQLLGELGITRWVSQQTPVVDEPLSFVASSIHPAAQEFDNHDLTALPSATTVALNADLSNSLNDDLVQTDTFYHDQSVQHRSPLSVESDNPLTPPITSLQTPTHQSNLINNRQPQLMVKRFRIQAIAFRQWLLLVDERALQQDRRQQALWQQISLSLQSSIFPYTFPLLETVDSLPMSSQQIMSNMNIARAAFEGFAYAITAGKHRNIGSVSDLPNYFEAMPVTRLPTLADMLSNGNKKREFWQLLTQPI